MLWVCELVARVCVDDAVLIYNAKQEIESAVKLYGITPANLTCYIHLSSVSVCTFSYTDVHCFSWCMLPLTHRTAPTHRTPPLSEVRARPRRLIRNLHAKLAGGST